jgi:quercetin dioxygenase-like cupin family protein
VIGVVDHSRTPEAPMANAKFPQLPQFAGMFTRLGQQRDHKWEPMPWKGISNKVLQFDRGTGLTLELARIEKGAVFPEHYHTTVQTQFLISGRIELKSGDVLEPGTFNIIPGGQLHGVEEAITFKYFASVPVYILPTVRPLYIAKLARQSMR